MKENEKRLETKENLTLELKVMENDAILYSELVGQQTNLKAQIDKAFSENKLAQSADPNKSRLSVHSNKKWFCIGNIMINNFIKSLINT